MTGRNHTAFMGVLVADVCGLMRFLELLADSIHSDIIAKCMSRVT